MDSKKTFTCECGRHRIELVFHHSMPPELVDHVYCPVCEQHGLSNRKSWPLPGDWHLHFDLEVARMFAMAKLGIDPRLVNPGFIFDGGYVVPAAAQSPHSHNPRLGDKTGSAR